MALGGALSIGKLTVERGIVEVGDPLLLLAVSMGEVVMERGVLSSPSLLEGGAPSVAKGGGVLLVGWD